LHELRDALRERVPKPGTDYVKFMTVLVGPGEKVSSIDVHAHPEHTILYYVEPGVIQIADWPPVMPMAGGFVYLPPNTDHSVPKPKNRRVSVAMTVET
jgi:quercetin dioxygenase-like cupin family protein